MPSPAPEGTPACRQPRVGLHVYTLEQFVRAWDFQQMVALWETRHMAALLREALIELRDDE